MTMKLYNTLTKQTEDLEPLNSDQISIYSCGPTVYDHMHIGNLSSFIMVDTLRRVLELDGLKVKHVMNLTDIDDKTIARSQQEYPNDEPLQALKQLTGHFSEIFFADLKSVGNDTEAVEFVKATDNIDKIQQLIKFLHDKGFAYIADDGVYFSIEAYQSSGKHYGQLANIDTKNTSKARINNDEYDKDNVHDFALWKLQKPGEPSWDFELDGHNLTGRPGWHIECSAMSTTSLGQPFDIHTGGVDLIFPHHENEIAQSTAGHEDPRLARYFVHNEHLLVDGRKMSKSLNNFYTLRDIAEKDIDPLSFRLFVLESHYRSQSNFSWDNLKAAQNRLAGLRSMADMVWQPVAPKPTELNFKDISRDLLTDMNNDLNSPSALARISALQTQISEQTIHSEQVNELKDFLVFLDDLLGLALSERGDTSKEQKQLISERETARGLKHWEKSDQIRDELTKQGIELRDTEAGAIWQRL